MAYQVWSVVFGEQPSASKWNILGTNDAGFNDGTAIADDAILARHIANNAVSNAQMATDTFLWEKLADVTLGGTATSISSGTITARSFIVIMAWVVPTGGTLNIGLRFNNDSGANYGVRGSANGAADASGGSITQINTKTAINANPQFVIFETYNLAAQEKLVFFRSSERGTAGAANVPDRQEGLGKWANTSVQITRADIVDIGGTGDIASGSRLIVLGHD